MRSTDQHVSFVLLFEKYLKVLLPDFWFLVDDPRACDGLPDVEQGLAGVPVETGAVGKSQLDCLLPDLTCHLVGLIS